MDTLNYRIKKYINTVHKSLRLKSHIEHKCLRYVISMNE
jgi:hypothetical protein